MIIELTKNICRECFEETTHLKETFEYPQKHIKWTCKDCKYTWNDLQ